jgi:tRNA (guanine10-N2)-dimethyltransferase
MGEIILVGSGWNSFLFRAEINSLVNLDKIIHPRMVTISNNSNINNLSNAALLDDILFNSEIIDDCNISEKDISLLIHKWAVNNLPRGSFAIRTRKIGEEIVSLSSSSIEKGAGELIVSAYNNVDLETPEHEIVVILAGLEDQFLHKNESDTLKPVIIWGLRKKLPNKKEFESRNPIERPFFKPVSLDARLARLMISLSHKPGWFPKKIIDPFCGTGGIAIEAIIQGIDILASDLDPVMVEGTHKNLVWSKGEGGYTVKKCSIDNIVELWGKQEDCSFVFDPPYGRNSWKSDNGLDIFLKALKAAQSINPNGTICTMLPTVPEFMLEEKSSKNLVMGKKWEEIEALINTTGWVISLKYAIKVHRSLARLILVCHPSH